jgi:DNA replication protein DnaC
MEARRLTGCGVPPNMLGCTLDNFQVSSKLEGAAVAKCRKYVQERKGGLMIVGSDVGIGKTHLAIGVIRQWRQPLFITHAEMVRELREAYSSKGEPMRRMQSCELLCIDDLGIALHGRDEPSMWYEVLAWRHGHNLPFVLTSNLGPTELGAILDARLADRLRECSLVIKLAGKSKRRARE